MATTPASKKYVDDLFTRAEARLTSALLIIRPELPDCRQHNDAAFDALSREMARLVENYEAATGLTVRSVRFVRSLRRVIARALVYRL